MKRRSHSSSPSRRRRKGEGGRGSGHERWLVSYADLITLLFAFFTSMYAMSTVNEAKFRTLSEALSRAFRSPFEAVGGAGLLPEENALAGKTVIDVRSERSVTAFRRLERALERRIRNGEVSLLAEEDGVVVRIPGGTLFRPGEDVLLPSGRRVLDELGRTVRGFPDEIRIEGHTDNVPIKTERFESNWDLSAARALSVLKYLVRVQGLDPRRLSAAGYGEFRPVASNEDPGGRRRNRRVDIVIINGVRR